MYKTIKKIGVFLLGVAIFIATIQPVYAGPTSPGSSSPTTPGALCLADADTWVLCESTFTFGDTSNPIANGEFTLLTVGTLTTGGILMTGDIDMDGYNLILDTDGDTALVNDRDAAVGDDEIGITLNSGLDFLFAENLLRILPGSELSVEGGTFYMGTATYDTGDIVMQDGNQTGDDTLTFSLSHDGAGDATLQTSDGHLHLVSMDDITLSPADAVGQVVLSDTSARTADFMSIFFGSAGTPIATASIGAINITSSLNADGAAGLRARSVLEGDTQGITTIYGRTDGYSAGGTSGNESYVYKADMQGDNNDTDHSYVAYEAEFNNNGGAGEATGMMVGAGFELALAAESGDLGFLNYDPEINTYTMNAGDGNGLIIGLADAVTAGDGGELVINTGRGIGGGVDGKVVIMPKAVATVADTIIDPGELIMMSSSWDTDDSVARETGWALEVVGEADADPRATLNFDFWKDGAVFQDNWMSLSSARMSLSTSLRLTSSGGGTIETYTNGPIVIQGDPQNGSGDEALKVMSYETLATPGDNLQTWYNNGSLGASMDYLGFLTAGLRADKSVTIMPLGTADVGNPTYASNDLDITGSAWDTDDAVERPTGAKVVLSPTSGASTGGVLSFSFTRDGAVANTMFSVNSGGTVTANGGVRAGSGLFYPTGAIGAIFQGADASDGAAIATTLSSSVALNTAGDKMTSWDNNGSEVAFIDYLGNISSLGGLSTMTGGTAITAGSYQIGRNADGTNLMQFNVPTGAAYEWSVNDVAIAALSTAGALSGLSSVSATTLTDGVASISAGAISGITTLDMAGTLTNTLPAASKILIDASSTAHTDTDGVIDLNLTTATADVTGININTTLTGDVDGVAGVISTITGFATGGVSENATWAFEASMIGSVNDTDHFYIGYGAGDFVANGGAGESVAFEAGAGHTFLLMGESGDIQFYHTPTVISDPDSDITAATEFPALIFGNAGTKTWEVGAGPLASQREFQFIAPTYDSNPGTPLTITDSSTVYISGAPIQGANITLTNTYAQHIASGTTLFETGAIQMGDADSDASTFTMIKGAQAGDPQVQFALSADANGDYSITTDTGDITLEAALNIYLNPLDTTGQVVLSDTTARTASLFSGQMGAMGTPVATDNIGAFDFTTYTTNSSSNLNAILYSAGMGAGKGAQNIHSFIVTKVADDASSSLSLFGGAVNGSDGGDATLIGLNLYEAATNTMLDYVVRSAIGANIQMFEPVNNANPSWAFGATATEQFSMTAGYKTDTQSLESVTFATATALADADAGGYIFNVDAVDILVIADAGIEVTGDVSATTIASIAVANLVDKSATAVVTGAWDFGGGGLEIPNGTTIPGTCTVGQMFQDTDSDDCADTGAGDGALCLCKTTNVWALISNF